MPPLSWPCPRRSSSGVTPSVAKRSSSVRTTSRTAVSFDGQAADGDRERAGVGVVRGEGVDRVRQPAVLADLLEQPRRRAATQGAVEDPERVAALVGAGQSIDAEHEVDLLERPAHHDLTRRRTAQPPGTPHRHRHRVGVVEEARAGERLADLPHHGRVVQVAGHRDDRVRSGVVRAVEATHLRAGQRLHRLDGAGYRPAQRGGTVARRREQVADHVVGVVVVHGDLVEDHLALRLDICCLESRRRHHVAEHVDRTRQVLVTHTGVEAGVLLRREGVDLAADLVELHREVERGARRRALEQQVLEEVRGPGKRRDLVTRPDTDPHADRSRPHAWHRLGHDPQPTREDGTADRSPSVPGGEQRAGRARRLLGGRPSHGPVRVPSDAYSADSSSTTGTSDSLPRSSISPISTWIF